MEKLYGTGNIYRVPVEELISPGEYINKYMTSEEKLIKSAQKGYLRTITEGPDKHKYYEVCAPEVVYNKIYTNNNELCKGEKYTVLSVFNKNLSEDSEYKSFTVVVLMLDSATILKIPYYKLCNNDIYDPYYLRLFNNQCCIGNVKTANLTERENGIYALWKEIMGRLYNKDHYMYEVFREYDIQIAVPNWKCFEYFYNYYLHYESHFDNVLQLNPNDPIWYNANFKITREASRALWKCPYNLAVATTGHRLPERIRMLTMRQRVRLSKEQIRERDELRNNIINDIKALNSEYNMYKPSVDALRDVYITKRDAIHEYYDKRYAIVHITKAIPDVDESGKNIMYEIVNPNMYTASDILATDHVVMEYVKQYDSLEPYITEYNKKVKALIKRINIFNSKYPDSFITDHVNKL